MRALLPKSIALFGSLLAAVSGAQPAPQLEGTLIVLNKRGDDASFIDLASGKLVATLPTGRGPHELVVTSDGRWAVATNYEGGNSLTVFDVQALEVARTIALPDHPAPHGMLLLPGEAEVVVTSEASNSLVTIDFHTGAIVNAVDTRHPGSHMVAISESGTVAYTANMGSDSVSVIDLEAGRFLHDLSVPASPEAIATNHAGSQIWVGSNDRNVVSVIDPDDGSIERQWSGFGWPYRILLTRDERFAVIPDMRVQNLRFFDVASGTELGNIPLSGMDPQGVTLHPDDRTLFLSLSATDKVLVIDIETRSVIGEYETGNAPDGIAYSALTVG